MEVEPESRMALSRFARTVSPSQQEVEAFLNKFSDATLLSLLETTADTSVIDDILSSLEHLCRSSTHRLMLWGSPHMKQIMNSASKSPYPPARIFLSKRLCQDFLTLPESLQESLKATALEVACIFIFHEDSAALDSSVEFLLLMLSSKSVDLSAILDMLQQCKEGKPKKDIFKQQCVVAVRLASVSPDALAQVASSGLLDMLSEFLFSSDASLDILLSLVVYELLCELIHFPEAVVWLHETQLLDHIWDSLCQMLDEDSCVKVSKAQLMERVIQYCPETLVPLTQKNQRLLDTYLTSTLIHHSGDEIDTNSALGLFSALLSSGCFASLDTGFPKVMDMALDPRVKSSTRNAALKSLEQGLSTGKTLTTLLPLYSESVVKRIAEACKRSDILVESRLHLYSLLTRILLCFPSLVEEYRNDMELQQVLNVSSTDSEVTQGRLRLKRILFSFPNEENKSSPRGQHNLNILYG